MMPYTTTTTKKLCPDLFLITYSALCITILTAQSYLNLLLGDAAAWHSFLCIL